MSEVDRSPARLSRWLAVSGASVALVASGFYSWTALTVGLAGFALLVGGVVRGHAGAVTVGAFALFVGAVVAGVQRAPVIPVLGSVTAAVLAWDSGGTAISVGAQLGREADTTRVEAVHAVASLAVGGATAGVGYGLYRVGTGGLPVAAVVFFLVAAVLLVAALD